MRRFAIPSTLTWAALFVGLGVALVAIALTLGPARGADHRDSPGVAGDPAADITDIYAFRNGDNLVVALNVNGLTAPPDNLSRNFAEDVAYNIHVDTTGDIVADITLQFTFSGGTFTLIHPGPPITGPVTPPSLAATPPDPLITTAGPVKIFAGQRDDPFFFDLVGFQQFVKGPFVPASGLRPAGQTPSDTFAGTNISAIVIELPITAVTGAASPNTGVIRAWATTSRLGAQVDRMAIPAINTALIPSSLKETFNKSDPVNDAAAYRPIAQATIESLRAAVDAVFGTPQDGGPLGNLTAAQVATALIPDVVTIDFSQPLQFPNGRRLQDDVIDAALGVVLNRGGAAGISDAVNGNDKAFLSTFPYLAPPHQPAAPAPTPAALPPTGDGRSGGDGFNWQLSIMIAAGAVLAAAGLGLLVRRRLAR